MKKNRFYEPLGSSNFIIRSNKALGSSNHGLQSLWQTVGEVEEIVSVDIKSLWWIHNRPIIHDKIFMIKLISNWWRGRLANEIKPRGNIKWKKPYSRVRRKDLYGKFLLNEIPN